jgi:hypothetical protein
MGMFDSIKCKKELPLTDELKKLNVKWDEVVFQTKDLENCLSNYIISEDSELLEEVVKYEYTYFTEEERKHKDHRPWNIVKDQKVIEQYTKKVDFHGTIMFYESFNYSEQEDVWVDFNAYFIYGKLDKIEIDKIEKYQARTIKMDEYWKAYEKQQNSFYHKLKKYLGWFWFWKKIGIVCYKISIFFGNVNSFIIKHII